MNLNDPAPFEHRVRSAENDWTSGTGIGFAVNRVGGKTYVGHGVAPNGSGPVGEVVRFIEEGGRVVRMLTGDSYVDRIK